MVPRYVRIKVSFAERVITINALDFFGISVNTFSMMFHINNRKLLQTNAAFNFLLVFVKYVFGIGQRV